ncbi:MAG: DUF456 family protein [Myxococcota bacterium]
MEPLAWTVALVGIALGGVAGLVPGFPGCAVALLGLVGFASLTDFAVVPPSALVFAAGLTAVGSAAQLVGPVAASRALGGSAGAATGAAIGAALGAAVPLPGASWAGAVIGALSLGLVASRRELTRWVRGVVGATGGCLVGVAADELAVLGIAAVLGTCDFLAQLPP